MIEAAFFVAAIVAAVILLVVVGVVFYVKYCSTQSYDLAAQDLCRPPIRKEFYV